MRPKPMPGWFRRKIAYFFLLIAALIIAVNTVVIGLGFYTFAYILAGATILAILLSLWVNTAPEISDEEFWAQKRARDNRL